MSNSHSTLILGNIKCKHCAAVFPVPRVAELRPGFRRGGPTPAQAALQATIQTLMLHLSQAHKEIAVQAVVNGSQLQGVLILRNFVLTEEIAKQGDAFRRQVHQATRAIQITDEKIAERVAAAELDKLTPAELRPAVENLIREFRDVLTETITYQEPGPQPGPQA